MNTTCQICARPIQASTGVIAHHGYKRPGNGWQTASCRGARYLPYEQSCDQIPPTIEFIKKWIEDRELWLKNFIANPPAEITRFATYRGDKDKIYPRPENFDPNYKYGGYRYDQQYELEFANRKYHTGKEIEQAKKDLQFLEERLANWVAPIGEVSK